MSAQLLPALQRFDADLVIFSAGLMGMKPIYIIGSASRTTSGSRTLGLRCVTSSIVHFDPGRRV